MCSRYTLTSPVEAVRSYFGQINECLLAPRYNIAPTQPSAIIRLSARGQRELALVRWGLIPSWVKDPNEFATLVNARAETVTQKPSFRSSIRYRRCLVPANGFYEWTGPKGAKQPHLIHAKNASAANVACEANVASAAKGEGTGERSGEVRPLFAMAGIWEHWMGADGSEMETMAIITTSANQFMAPLHNRMPVILHRSDFERWLECKMGRSADIEDLLGPVEDDFLDEIAVNPELNNPRNEGAQLQCPALLL